MISRFSLSKNVSLGLFLLGLLTGGFGLGRSVEASTDIVPPTVSAISPTTVIKGEWNNWSITYSDDQAIGSCTIQRIDSATSNPMARSAGSTNTAGTMTIRTAVIENGTYQYRATCRDTSGNVTVGPITTINVYTPVTPSSSPTGPVVGMLNERSATAGTPITFTATYSDSDAPVTNCSLYIGGGAAQTMTRSGAMSGTASYTYTFSSAGDQIGHVACTDENGNISAGTGVYISVAAATVPAGDTTPPIIGAISPIVAQATVPVTFSAAASDNSGTVACDLYVNGINYGSHLVSGGVATQPVTFDAVGTINVFFRCVDSAGNSTTGTVTPITVSAAPVTPTPAPTDTTPPAVSSIYPTSVTIGYSTVFSAGYSDAGTGVVSCSLWVDGARTVAVMSGSGSAMSGNVVAVATFSSLGDHLVRVDCLDGAGNTGSRSATVTVNAAATTTAPPSSTSPPTSTPVPTPTAPMPMGSGMASAGTLLKLACPNYAVAADHPCKAVYYYGRDGRRHAFPNSNVYFTWYTDFSGVMDVTSAFLSSLPLGNNVTYRPGVRLVKFTTLNRVYAVGRNGTLRWITSEEAAQRLYGMDWARMVDDISDVFYTNYHFGADVMTSADFNPVTEMSGATNIDLSL